MKAGKKDLKGRMRLRSAQARPAFAFGSPARTKPDCPFRSPATRHVLLSLAVLLLFAAPLFSTLSIIPPPPPSPPTVAKSQPVQVSGAVVACQGGPCLNPPPNSHFDLRAFAMDAGQFDAKAGILLGAPAEVVYSCQAHADCAGPGDKFLHLQAVLVAEDGTVLDTSVPPAGTPTGIIMRDLAPPAPPARAECPPVQVYAANPSLIPPIRVFQEQDRTQVDYHVCEYYAGSDRLAGISSSDYDAGSGTSTCLNAGGLDLNGRAGQQLVLNAYAHGQNGRASGALAGACQWAIEDAPGENPNIHQIAPPEGAGGIDAANPVTITAHARQGAPGDARKHRYTWTYEGGRSEVHGPFDLDAQLGTSDTFDCTYQKCGRGLSVKVEALDGAGQPAGLRLRPIRIKSSGNALSAPNPLIPKPARPKDSEPFIVEAYGDKGADAFVFAWTSSKGGRSGVQEAAAQDYTDGKGKVLGRYAVLDTPDFDCTPDKCRGAKITITAFARKGAERSDLSELTVVPQPKPLEYKPEIASISPDDGYRLDELKNAGATSIEQKSYALKIGPPAGKSFDKYEYRQVKEDVANPASGYATANGNTLSLTADCSGCREGGTISYEIIGIKDGVKSSALGLALTVPLPGGIVSGADVAGIGNGAAGTICDADVWLQSWMPLIAMGFGALIGLIALTYMLGTAFNTPQLIEWSKTEIGQALLGIGLFIVVVWLLNLECNLRIGEFARWAGVPLGGASPINLQAGDTMRTAALKELEWAMQQTHLSVALIRHELGVLDIRATFMMSATRTPGVGGNGYSFSPLSGDWTMMGSLQMLLNLNTTFVIALLFQYFSLAIFSSASGLFIFLVPLGLILRSMPYLRPFGGSLVAIGLGFYLMYPMFLALIGLMLPPLYAPAAGSPPNLVDSNDPVQIAGVRDVGGLVASEQKVTGSSAFYYFYSLPQLIRGAAGYEEVDCGLGRCFYTADLGPLYALTALNFVRAVLLPSAGIVVIVSLVRDLSAIFGEEVEASKLVQMM